MAVGKDKLFGFFGVGLSVGKTIINQSSESLHEAHKNHIQSLENEIKHLRDILNKVLSK